MGRNRVRRPAAVPDGAVVKGINLGTLAQSLGGRVEPGIVCGLDVSSSAAGWALVDAGNVVLSCGVIVPKGKTSTARVDEIVGRLRGVMDGPGERPAAVAMEWSAGKQHGKIDRKISGLAILGQAQGAVRQMIRSELRIPVRCYAEAEWTEGILKEKRAGLIELDHAAYRRFLKEYGDDGRDVADAIGVAIHDRRSLATGSRR